MTESPKPESEGAFLQSLSQFLQEDDICSIEELKESLRIEGVDVPSLLARAKDILQAERHQRLRSRRLLAAQQRAEFIEKFNKTTVAIPQTIEGLRKLLDKFATGVFGPTMQQAAVAQFKKYEHATKADLQLLVEDLLRLKAMQEHSEE